MTATLLDTHALIWLTAGDLSLGPQSRRLADAAVRENGLLVSAITFWEVAMLARRDLIDIGQPPISWRGKVLELGIEEMPVTGEIGILATDLEGFHSDPADRIIVATALTRGAALVTADSDILEWTGTLARHNARR